MKFLIDMNLSPVWCEVLHKYGWEAVHWTDIGNKSASDSEIFHYAAAHGYIIFTHDLDFSVLLALSSETGPSVIHIRTADTMPDKIENIIIPVIKKYQELLIKGALISIDKVHSRIRVLPLNQKD